MMAAANSLSKDHFRECAGCDRSICEMLKSRRNPDGALARQCRASGDLAPLAHLALALIGEGECLDEKGFASSRWFEAMRRAQIRPLVLEAKEAGLLDQRTQAMLAVGILALLAAEILAGHGGCHRRALGSMRFAGTDVAFDERIHRASDPGQLRTAAKFAQDAR